MCGQTKSFAGRPKKFWLLRPPGVSYPSHSDVGKKATTARRTIALLHPAIIRMRQTAPSGAMCEFLNRSFWLATPGFGELMVWRLCVSRWYDSPHTPKISGLDYHTSHTPTPPRSERQKYLKHVVGGVAPTNLQPRQTLGAFVPSSVFHG